MRRNPPSARFKRVFIRAYLATQILFPLAMLYLSHIEGAFVRLGWQMFARVVGCVGE